MDQLEAWAVRGRVAAAKRSVREALVSLLSACQELKDSVAEADLLEVGIAPVDVVGAVHVGAGQR